MNNWYACSIILLLTTYVTYSNENSNQIEHLLVSLENIPQHTWSPAYYAVCDALHTGIAADAQQVQQVLDECKALDAQQINTDLKHTIAQLMIYQQSLADASKNSAVPITKAGRAVLKSLVVKDNLEVDGSVVIEGNCRINGNETLAGNLHIGGNIITDGQIVNGNETINGDLTVTGTTTLSSLGAGAVVTNSNGVVSSITGTAGQVLTSNGAGNAPTFQTSSGGISTLNADSGSATGSTVTIAGGSNITTSAAGSTLTVDLDNSPSVSGSLTAGTTVTAGTGITATTGNISASAGNFNLASTNSAGTQGVITMQGVRILHRGATPTADSFYAGMAAGLTSATGIGNTGCGFHSLTAISTGLGNTAVGFDTLASVTTSGSNTAIGTSALGATTGDSNTAVGAAALNSITTGARNTALGVSAGSGLTGTESNNIMIGNSGIAGDNNIIRIGTSGGGAGQQNQCFIAGISGVTTGGAAVAVLVDGNGQLGTVSSSAKYKENIVPMGSDTDRLMNLRPVMFTMKSDTSKSKRYGLIAEEVALIFPELVVYKDGQPETVKYHDLAIMLLNEFQKKCLVIDAQHDEILQLKEQLIKIIAELEVLKLKEH